MLDQTAKPRARPFRLTQWECSEFEIQVSLVDALRKFAAPDCLWLHIGNGERRDVITGSRLKRMGLRPGAADQLKLRPWTPSPYHEIQKRIGMILREQYEPPKELPHQLLVLLIKADRQKGGKLRYEAAN